MGTVEDGVEAGGGPAGTGAALAWLFGQAAGGLPLCPQAELLHPVDIQVQSLEHDALMPGELGAAELARLPHDEVDLPAGLQVDDIEQRLPST